MTSFTRLKDGWNAEPNAPDPKVRVEGTDLVLSFRMNHRQYPEYAEGNVGELRFARCSRLRLGATNDEGWPMGRCRFSGIAPAGGEFYELSGDLRLGPCPDDWIQLAEPSAASRHFLFYLRDDTFECDAESWTLRVVRASQRR